MARPVTGDDGWKPDRTVDPESLTLSVALPVGPADSASLRRHERRRGVADSAPALGAPRVVGNYRLSKPIGTGGMATVHLGVRTDDDSPRVYAIKRLHAQFAHDEQLSQMLLDEAAIAARIRHENVVTMYGAGVVGRDLILVMEYVAGLTVADLIQAEHPRKLPPRMLTAIIADALRGLHAAHETVDEHGRSLAIIHRDVSPQNVHLGADGVARVLDFGIAKAERRSQTTRTGELKGKIAYMAPEQLAGARVDRRVDIRAAAVVLWEALAGAPLFHAENESATMARVLAGCSEPPSQVADGVPPALDEIVMRALAKHPEERFATALEMADALDDVFGDSTPPTHETAAWLNAIAADTLVEQWDLRSSLLNGGASVARARRRQRAAPPVASVPVPSAPASSPRGASAPPTSPTASLPPVASPSGRPLPLPVESTVLVPLPSGDRYAETTRHSARARLVPSAAPLPRTPRAPEAAPAFLPQSAQIAIVAASVVLSILIAFLLAR